MPSEQDSGPHKSQPEIDSELLPEQPTQRDRQIEELQQSLADEQDARREERFVFIVIGVLLLDVVFFTVMPSFGGPIALLVLQLLILVPLARRMGMQEIAELMDRVVSRVIPGRNGE